MSWHGLWDAVVGWDRRTMLEVAATCRTPVLDRVMPHITDLGLGHVQAIATLVVAAILASRSVSDGRRWQRPTRAAMEAQFRWLGPMLLATLLAGIVAPAAKEAIASVSPRLRPVWFYTLEHRQGRHMETRLGGVPGRRPLRANGFPSGHTATSFAVGVVAVLVSGRRRLVGTALAALFAASVIGFSRVYMADHWPLDVLGGAVVGLLCGFAAMAVARRGHPFADLREALVEVEKA
ncbi:MAG: phosphatase PAP2 family protein [Armatimonadetes bacterium]|nr:phosphatase PAP2 family protein [Armatimonadota bacterium]